MSDASDFWSSSEANCLKCLPFKQAWPLIPQAVKEEMVRKWCSTPIEVEKEVEEGDSTCFDGKDILSYLYHDQLSQKVSDRTYILPVVTLSGYFQMQIETLEPFDKRGFVYFFVDFLTGEKTELVHCKYEGFQACKIYQYVVYYKTGADNDGCLELTFYCIEEQAPEDDAL